MNIHQPFSLKELNTYLSSRFNLVHALTQIIYIKIILLQMYGPIKGTFKNSLFYYLSCYFSLTQILGFTNPTPLTEISSSRFVIKRLQ